MATSSKLKEKMLASAFGAGRQNRAESVSSIEAAVLTRNRFAAADRLEGGGDSARQAAEGGQRADEVFSLPTDTEWSAEYASWCRENRYRPGAVISVSLSAVKPSDFNPRHFYVQKSIDELATSIAEDGQHQPIHIVPDYNCPGEFFLHDGGNRVRALNKLRRAEARAFVVDVPVGIQSYKLGWELNSRRDAQTPFDNAVKWAFLLEKGHFASQKDLAESLGQDQTIVSLTLTIGRLQEKVLLAMMDNQDHFPVRVAYEVSKFYEDNGGNLDETLDLVRRIVKNDMKQKAVIEFRSRYKSERGTARPRRSSGGARVPTPVAAPDSPKAADGISSARSTLGPNDAAPAGVAEGAAPQLEASTLLERFVSESGRVTAELHSKGGRIDICIAGVSEDDLATALESCRTFLANLVR